MKAGRRTADGRRRFIIHACRNDSCLALIEFVNLFNYAYDVYPDQWPSSLLPFVLQFREQNAACFLADFIRTHRI